MEDKKMRYNVAADVERKIIDYCRDNHITQADLAKNLDLSQQRISTIFKGNGHFNIDDIVNFAIKYDMSVDDLVDLETRKEKKGIDDKTFSDILSRLFYIHSSNVGTMSLADHHDDTMEITINISGSEMIEILNQWLTATKLNVTDKSGQQVVEIVKESLLKQAADLKAEYNYKSEFIYMSDLYIDAKETLERAGFSEPNYGVNYDEYKGQVEKVHFNFSREDYDLLCQHYKRSYVVEEIDILIKEKAASFKYDLPFD